MIFNHVLKFRCTRFNVVIDFFNYVIHFGTLLTYLEFVVVAFREYDVSRHRPPLESMTQWTPRRKHNHFKQLTYQVKIRSENAEKNGKSDVNRCLLVRLAQKWAQIKTFLPKSVDLGGSSESFPDNLESLLS